MASHKRAFDRVAFEMKRNFCTVVLILFIVCLTCVASVEENAVKSREKRSPKPQFPKFIFGQIAKWIPKVIKQGGQVVEKVEQFVSKNPGTVGAAVVGGVGVATVLGQKRERQPVFFNIGSPRSLMLPVDGNLTWAQGERSWIACPPSEGSRNSIRGIYLVSAEIECKDGYDFEYVHNGAVFDITQVQCDNRVTGNVKTDAARVQCPGTHKTIGFDVTFPTIGNRFFDLYQICFDEPSATAIYTHHTLIGNEIEHKCFSTRPDFKSAGFPQGLAVSSAYNQESQLNRLVALFGADPNPWGSAEVYYNLSYLQRGHLVPDADQLFTTWQWSTYFYLNVVGMWEHINNGNWKYLESNVRTLAQNAKKTLEVYTGVYDTLSLCSLWDHCPEFTLSNGRIPVPKWLWKVVKSPDLNAAIALVVSNNPFVGEDPICGLNGASHGWNSSIVSNITYGTVSYCRVQDLQTVVGNIPQEAMAPSILSFVVSTT
ncbi:uncharacterized protein LOC5577135 isoform X2 [Aedes aegypti]|uniref:DNA/RNA non-specific endonuclease/pyrophosphatase/phosphodiesterase domain-containing protein n=1 Tax=Aedes aegypti TaxID=7159 RepID=A0A6I8T8B6_AEDAE|nr:uncharacterized protein LOC5577135 isoform X2 [Aedes aegypti]